MIEGKTDRIPVPKVLCDLTAAQLSPTRFSTILRESRDYYYAEYGISSSRLPFGELSLEIGGLLISTLAFTVRCKEEMNTMLKLEKNETKKAPLMYMPT